MEEALHAYDELKRDRGIKKSLLTRSITKLRTVVSRGRDAQADTVNSARRRARECIEELEKINVQMETTLLNWNIAYEVNETDDSIPTSRMMDIEKNIDEMSMKEAEIDQLQREWLESHATETANADTNADVMTKTLQALEIITEKLTSPKQVPSIRTTSMNPPKWDGHFKNFYSWRIQFEQYLKSAAIYKDEDKLMFILHASILPHRVSASIESCTTMSGPNGVWERLEEKVPKAAVIKEIISEMEAIRPIRQKTASEMRAVLDRLTDFARRMT